MLKCREVEANSSRMLDQAMPWRERMSMQMHLLICRHCRRFVRHLQRVKGMMSLRGHEPAAADTVLRVQQNIRVNEPGSGPH